MVGQRSWLLTRSRRLFTASHQVRAQDLGALREASEIIIGEAVQERYLGNVVQQMLFLHFQSSGNQRIAAFFHRNLAPHRHRHRELRQWSHWPPWTRGRSRGKPQNVLCVWSAKWWLFFSVEVCVFSCCLTCPIRHGATQTCTRTTKTQSLSTLRHSQLKRRSWVLALQDLTEQFAAVPSNSEVNAQIEADETAVRREHGLLDAQTVSDTVARVEAIRIIISANQLSLLRSSCEHMWRIWSSSRWIRGTWCIDGSINCSRWN